MKALLIAVLLLGLGDSLAKADIDWRTKGAVTSVRNQGASACNLSWAFATAGVVEGATAVQTGTLYKLSEQELVDCASSCGGSGSAGQCPASGCPQLGRAFTFIETRGLCSEASYPYTGQAGACVPCPSPAVPSGFARNWTRLSGEAGLIGALAAGPVLARLEIGAHGQTLPSYLAYDGSSIFRPTGFDTTVVQWVVLVGYTSSYYVVKNSLGTAWGAGGYMKLARGGNFLGVNNYAYSLMAGSPSAGSCALPDGSCAEMTSADCSAADGSFGGVGTFCATPCPASAAIAAVPTLSYGAMASLAFVLAMVGLAPLLRKENPTGTWVRRVG